MSVDHLNGNHETFIGQFIKWTISGELPIGLESHQDSLFWSNRPLFSEGYCERPCSYSFIHKYWCRDEFWRGQDVLAILTQNGAHTNFDQDQALKFFQWGCNPNNLCLVNVQTAGGVKREQYLFVTWCVYPNPDLGRSRCPINGREKQEQKFAKNCFIITSNQIPIRFCQAPGPQSLKPKLGNRHSFL